MDGFHITTKSNWIVECIATTFICLRSDIIRPHRCTSEPSENSIVQLRSIVREFTTSELIKIISKINRFWVARFRSNLSTVRSVNKIGGYSATVETHVGGVRSVVLHSGPVHIENNLSKI